MVLRIIGFEASHPLPISVFLSRPIAYVNHRKVLVPNKILTSVVTRNTIFWNITPCSPLKVNRRFGGTYRLHLQG
jgi:hypothetical protein